MVDVRLRDLVRGDQIIVAGQPRLIVDRVDLDSFGADWARVYAHRRADGSTVTVGAVPDYLFPTDR